MKKFFAALAVAVGVIGLVLIMRYHPAASASGQTTPLSSTPTTNTTPTSYKDGSYTGDAVDVGYGIVQVKATVSGSKITQVTLLQMPNDREHSVEISNYSGPQLIQEALQAQSANVDIVSGATSTSEGFQQSLQSALNKA